MDWEGALYCGIKLKWNIDYSQVELSMPRYVEKLPHKYQYTPRKKEYAPHLCHPITCGVKGQQTATSHDTSPPLKKT